MAEEIRYYTSYTQDFVEARNPDYQLAENYQWQRNRKWQKAVSRGVIGALALFSKVYLEGIHQIHVVNPEVLPEGSSPAFLFLNHTQPVMDPFLPRVILKPRPFCSICAPSNFSIPVLGRLLPWAGAIPTASSPSQLKAMKAALQQAVADKKWIVIYPEAHVWPWCSWIRPFEDTSFQFCLDTGLPAYCGVLRYLPKKTEQKKSTAGNPEGLADFGDRNDPEDRFDGKSEAFSCSMDVKLAGPFYPDPALPRRKARRQLRDEVYNAMNSLARESTYEKIRYLPADDHQMEET